MDTIEFNIETDADGVSENYPALVQAEKTSSGAPAADDDYFYFDLNCNGKSYAIRAKDADSLPSIITIPSTHNGLPVTVIAENGFSQCNQLSIVLFEESSNIKTIGSYAFFECKNIESIDLPESLQNLDSFAFAGCAMLQQVYFRSECPPCLGIDVFSETSPFLNLYVPACSVCHYKQAPDWRQYRDLILPSPEHIPSSLGFFRFELNQGGESYTIYGKDGAAMPLCLAIPGYYNRKPVTGIGAGSFRERQIIEIVIPDTVEEIGAYALAFPVASYALGYVDSQSILKRVIFGNQSNLTHIGRFALFGNLKLTGIKLPENVKVIEDYAFNVCGLTSVRIPENVETMGLDVFGECLQLKYVTVDKQNPFFRDIDGIMYNKAVTMLFAYPLARESHVFSVPATVTRLSEQSLWGAQNLRVLILNPPVPPERTMLFDIIGLLPALKFYVPEESYEAYINDPGWRRYADIIYKKSIIENGFAVEGNVLIQYVENSSEITIPKEIVQIGNFALTSIPVLKKITVEEGNANFIAEEGVLFDHDMTKLICYPPAKEAKEYEVPETIGTIGIAAFFDCKILSVVKVHKRLEILEDYAFFRCAEFRKLINLDARDTIKSIGFRGFFGCALIEEIRFMAVETVGLDAFSLCFNLKQMTFGPDIKELGRMFISSDQTLEQIDLKLFALTPPITPGFIHAAIKAIHVPAESVELYKTTLPWSRYSDIIYPLSIILMK